MDMDINLRVIEAVKTCPKLYKNKASLESRKEQWEILAQRFNMDENILRARWHMLREAFIRWHSTPNKLGSGRGLGRGSVKRTKRNNSEFEYKNELEFLLPYVQCRIAAETNQPDKLEFVITKEDLERMDDTDECAFQELDITAPIKLECNEASEDMVVVDEPIMNNDETIQLNADEENQALAKMLLTLNALPNEHDVEVQNKADDVSVATKMESTNLRNIRVRNSGQLIKVVDKRMEQALHVETMRKMPNPVAFKEDTEKPTPTKHAVFKTTYIRVAKDKGVITNTEHHAPESSVKVTPRPIENNMSTNTANVLKRTTEKLVRTVKPDTGVPAKQPKIPVKVVIKKTELVLPKKVIIKKADNMTPAIARPVIERKPEPVAPKEINNAVTENSQEAVCTKVDNAGSSKPIATENVTKKREGEGKRFVIIKNTCYASNRLKRVQLKRYARKSNLYRIFGNFIGEAITLMPKEKRRATMNKMLSLL